MDRLFCITLGDPHSFNIEAIARLVMAARDPAYPMVLMGSRWHWDDQCRRLSLQVPPLRGVSGWEGISSPGFYFMDCGPDMRRPAEQLQRQECGAIAVAALQALVRIPPQVRRLAVLTAPIDKKAVQTAGFRFPGQTEYFEQLWGTPGIMILAGSRLRVGLVTNHVPLRDVADQITIAGVARKLTTLDAALRQQLGLSSPRIGVCGLNPHCGDGGLFGSEDTEVIAPAVALCRQQGINVVGPLPADTLFFRGYQGDYQGILAMYHDQGLGPLKTVHFYDAVNITGGLPHLRVSPDHGPAQDHFLLGTGRLDSFQNAWMMCERYCLS